MNFHFSNYKYDDLSFQFFSCYLVLDRLDAMLFNDYI
jgi:hypothetical protein